MSQGSSPDQKPQTSDIVSFNTENEAAHFNDYKVLDGKFADPYARQYYLKSRGVPSDEHIVADHLIPFLRAFHKGGVCLDPATGSTSHHQIFLAEYFDSLHCGDYLSDNREFVQKFVVQAPGALPWEHYAEFYLEKQNKLVSPEAISEVISITRQKIGKDIFPTNLMTSPIVNNEFLYDAISCFYCLEEVARTEEGLFNIVRNVAERIKPGGAFMASCLANSEFYLLKNEDGSVTEIPCLWMDEDRLSRAVEAAGLEIPHNGITLKDTEGQATEGLPGILVVYARKPDNC
jgi:hypothetical protein